MPSSNKNLILLLSSDCAVMKVPVQWMEVGWGRFTLASTSMVQCTKPCNSGQIHPETVMETSQLDTPPGPQRVFTVVIGQQPWDNDTCLTHFVPSIGRAVPSVIFGEISMQLKVALTAAIAFGACVPAHAQMAATSVARSIGLPRRVTTILEGESLLNDATALVTCARPRLRPGWPPTGQRPMARSQR